MKSRSKNILFTEVYNTYYGKVFSYIYRMVGCKSASKDVCQNVFAYIWEKTELDAENLEARIFRIANSRCIDYLRSQKSKRQYYVLNELPEKVISENPEQILIDQQEYNSLISKIDELAPQQKSILKLAKLEGLSIKQISEISALSPKTIEHHISAAKRNLKTSLSKVMTIFF